MVIRKPPEKKSESDIEALIRKGAKVKSDSSEEVSPEWSHIHLRIPTKMIEGIDIYVKDRPGMTRTGWILEALQEKIKHSMAYDG